MPDQGVILLVEDKEDDIIVVRRAFERGGIPNPLQVVRDGEEAIEYLQGFGKYRNREEYPLPALILLDLKMPGMDGFEVLQWIRSQPGLGSVPVVVLTSSFAVRDINKAYRVGANSFMVKPMDFDNTVELARTVKKYWLVMSKGPETSRPAGEPGAAQERENGAEGVKG